MNASAALRAGVGRRGGPAPDTRASAAGIGLWVFMGVATALFSLFVTAYVMRMNGSAELSQSCQGSAMATASLPFMRIT